MTKTPTTEDVERLIDRLDSAATAEDCDEAMETLRALSARVAELERERDEARARRRRRRGSGGVEAVKRHLPKYVYRKGRATKAGRRSTGEKEVTTEREHTGKVVPLPETQKTTITKSKACGDIALPVRNPCGELHDC